MPVEHRVKNPGPAPGGGSVSAHWYAGGDLGIVLSTLPTIRRLVKEAVSDPLTVLTARGIVGQCPPRDLRCEAQAIRAFLAGHFRFVRDPAQQETLTPPRLMLEQLSRDGVVSGDCDEAATLGAALAAAVGFRPFAMVAGFRRRGAAWQHIFTTLPLDARMQTWVDLDVTRPRDQPRPRTTRYQAFKLY